MQLHAVFRLIFSIINKRIFPLLIIILISTACATKDENGSTESADAYSEPSIIGGVELQGLISYTSDEKIITFADYKGNLDITEPLYRDLEVDTYFRISAQNIKYDEIMVYSVCLDDTEPACDDPSRGTWHLQVFKESSFSRLIYLRFPNMDYEVYVYGKNSQDSSYTGLARFNVRNKTAVDLRYYLPSAQIQVFYNAINAKALELTSELNSDEEKAKVIHDWLVMYIRYDVDYINDLSDRVAQDAVSVYKSGLAVCEGYANLYAAMLRSLGMQTKYIVSDDMNHAWNEVFWNSSWHKVDVTWDDPLMGPAGQEHSDYPNGENLRDDYFDFSNPDHYNDYVDPRRHIILSN